MRCNVSEWVVVMCILKYILHGMFPDLGPSTAVYMHTSVHHTYCYQSVLLDALSGVTVDSDSLPSFFPSVRGYNPLIGLDVLCVQPISKAQSWQRCGRAGREGPGACYRLYTEETFQVCRGVEEMGGVFVGTPYRSEGTRLSCCRS